MKSIKSLFLFGLLAAALTSLMYGCGSQYSKTSNMSDQNVVWPSPPEIARIRFEYAFSKPEDLNIKEGLLAWLVGKSNNRTMQQPVAVTVGTDGTIFVADLNGTLFSFNQNEKKFQTQTKTKTGRLLSPVSLTIGSNDSLYVVDAGLKKVIVYTQDLVPRHEFDTGFNRPVGIGWNKNENTLLISDAAGHCVGKFELNGKCAKRFGTAGDSTLGFNTPTDVWVDGEKMYVTDALNFRVKLFTQNGEFRQSFAKMGTGAGAFSRPKGIATDSHGHLYIVDALFGNIQIFDSDGRLLMYFGQTGELAPGRFNLPNGIFIDSHDRIYVADTFHSSIQVFQYLDRPDSLKQVPIK